MTEKLSSAFGFTVFLLVAVGVHIDSHSSRAQTLYKGMDSLSVAAHNVLYGLSFAVMVRLRCSVVGSNSFRHPPDNCPKRRYPDRPSYQDHRIY